MAKKFRRILALAMVFILCFAQLAVPASAAKHDNDHGGYGNPWWGNYPWWGDNNNSEDLYEWYQVYVQGNLVASGQGANGNVYYLGTHYEANVSINGATLSWYINPIGGSDGNFDGTVDLRKYISIPEGYKVEDFVVEQSSIDGVNDPVYDMYDNAIISVTIKTLLTPDGEEVPVTPPAPVDYEPVLSIVKTADKAIYEIGESINWTITVQNNSEHTAHNVVVTDELVSGLWAVDALAPGESKVFTATTLAEAEGTVQNVAVVNWTDGDEIADEEEDETTSARDEETVTVETPKPADYEPLLTITKTADKEIYKVGETVTWTITVKNVSQYTAYDVVITDELLDGNWTIEALAPGASAYVTATAQAAEAGSLRNVAVVSWNDNDEIPDADEDETKSSQDEETVTVRDLIDYEPVLSLVKTADKAVYETGETITWTITVKNVSAHTAYGVTVSDVLTGDSWTIDALEAGATKSFIATTKTVAPGEVKNIVVAAWTDGDEIPDEKEDEITSVTDEETVTVEDPAPIDYKPLLKVSKTADKASYEAGETITWTITVKNVSEYTAYNVVITDELTGDSWTIDVLEPGASKSFTATTKTTEAGKVANTVVVNWTDNDEIPDEEENETKTTEDKETVTVEEPAPTEPPAPENHAPVLTVVKTADKAAYETGETITWTITVKNISEDPAYGIEVIDELVGGHWTIDVLEPAAEMTFVATSTAEAGTVTNVAVVNWTDNDELPDEKEDEETKTAQDEETVTVEDPIPEDYAPELTVVKTADKETYKDGETITWTITVKNVSEFSAYGIEVIDELVGGHWTIDVLEPAAEMTFTATSIAKAGTVKNVAVVNWTDNDEIPDEEEEEETKTTQDEEIVTVKEPDPIVPADPTPNDPTPTDPAGDDPVVIVEGDGYVEISDEEVPLAEVPKTGDISLIWAALSLGSGSLLVLKKKREED